MRPIFTPNFGGNLLDRRKQIIETDEHLKRNSGTTTTPFEEKLQAVFLNRLSGSGDSPTKLGNLLRKPLMESRTIVQDGQPHLVRSKIMYGESEEAITNLDILTGIAQIINLNVKNKITQARQKDEANSSENNSAYGKAKPDFQGSDFMVSPNRFSEFMLLPKQPIIKAFDALEHAGLIEGGKPVAENNYLGIPVPPPSQGVQSLNKPERPVMLTEFGLYVIRTLSEVELPEALNNNVAMEKHSDIEREYETLKN